MASRPLTWAADDHSTSALRETLIWRSNPSRSCLYAAVEDLHPASSRARSRARSRSGTALRASCAALGVQLRNFPRAGGLDGPDDVSPWNPMSSLRRVSGQAAALSGSICAAVPFTGWTRRRSTANPRRERRSPSILQACGVAAPCREQRRRRDQTPQRRVQALRKSDQCSAKRRMTRGSQQPGRGEGGHEAAARCRSPYARGRRGCVRKFACAMAM